MRERVRPAKHEVLYGDRQVAKFSDLADAVRFARERSRAWLTAELRERSGQGGRIITTTEFDNGEAK